MDDGRRLRTRWSASALIAGTALFWAASEWPVFRAACWTREGVDLFDGPGAWGHLVWRPWLAPTFAAAALAPCAWIAASWHRSAWARWLGALFVSLAIVALVGDGNPGEEPEIAPCDCRCGRGRFVWLERGSGWWLWAGADAVLVAAFAVLPAPVRPAIGERVPQDEVDAARFRTSAAVACLASVGLLALCTGFAPSGIWHDGVVLRTSAMGAMFDDHSWPAACGLLLSPVLWTLAVRRRWIRWAFAVPTAATLVMAAGAGEGYWRSQFVLEPFPRAYLLWYGVPLAYAAGLLLLPPPRELRPISA